jgi:hypothetical protein
MTLIIITSLALRLALRPALIALICFALGVVLSPYWLVPFAYFFADMLRKKMIIAIGWAAMVYGGITLLLFFT